MSERSPEMEKAEAIVMAWLEKKPSSIGDLIELIALALAAKGQAVRLHDRITALEEAVAKLDAMKCSHMLDKWGDGCINCNDGISKDYYK